VYASTHSPARKRAGLQYWKKRRGLTAAGREALRRAALRNKPWLASTGPRTPEGKATVALNGKQRQAGELSVREARRSLAEELALAGDLATMRRRLAEMLGSG
jgi:hypothetical protein